MKQHCILICSILTLCVTARADDTFKPEFYAFFNGVPPMSYDEEAEMLKGLGYNGISQVPGDSEQLVQRVNAYKKNGLKVLSVYLEASDKPVNIDLVKALENSGMIELTVKRISPEVIESIRETAEMAQLLNIRVALYPHHGNAVETMPQAIELAEKVNHPNLGIMFNLCHFLKNEKVDDLECVLEKAAPHLFAASTSGANLDGKSWDTLIQRLDKGTFPQKRLFATLKRLNFEGSVGLQCYGVKGDKRSNLKNSINAWKTILNELQ